LFLQVSADFNVQVKHQEERISRHSNLEASGEFAQGSESVVLRKFAYAPADISYSDACRERKH